MPAFLEGDRRILDIGCGIGQTFVASGAARGRLAVGLDIDFDSLAYGKRSFEGIAFVNAQAEALPFKDCAFDLVFSRVSLPYTHIPTSLRSIYRVLRHGGRTWLVLHPASMIVARLAKAVLSGKIKETAYCAYVLCNGIALHLFARLFFVPAKKRRCESFQTCSRTKKMMESLGFDNITVSKSRAILFRARKAGPAGSVA